MYQNFKTAPDGATREADYDRLMSVCKQIRSFHGRRYGRHTDSLKVALQEACQSAYVAFLETGSEKAAFNAASRELNFQLRIKRGGGRKNRIKSIQPARTTRESGSDQDHDLREILTSSLNWRGFVEDEYPYDREHAAHLIKSQLTEPQQAVLGCYYSMMQGSRLLKTLPHITPQQLEVINQQLKNLDVEVKEAIIYHATHRMREIPRFTVGMKGHPTKFELHRRHWGRLGFCPSCSALPDECEVYCCRDCANLK